MSQDGVAESRLRVDEVPDQLSRIFFGNNKGGSRPSHQAPSPGYQAPGAPGEDDDGGASRLGGGQVGRAYPPALGMVCGSDSCSNNWAGEQGGKVEAHKETPRSQLSLLRRFRKPCASLMLT